MILRDSKSPALMRIISSMAVLTFTFTLVIFRFMS